MDPSVRNCAVFTGWVGETSCARHPASVARRPRIPPELTKRPFRLEEARVAGLTLSCLRGTAWRRLDAELYCWSGLREDPWILLSAWRRLLPPEAVFAASTAAWLLGLDYARIIPSRSLCHRSQEFAPATGSGFAVVRSHEGRSFRSVGCARQQCSAPSPISVFCGPRWRPWLPSTWRSPWASRTLPLCDATPRRREVAQARAVSARLQHLRLPPNRRWRLGFGGC